MPVDATTPVPDELDARVEQMLQQMDRVHSDVVNRLEPSADEKDKTRSVPSPAEDLAGVVEQALRDATEAAKVATGVVDAQPAPAPAPPAPAPVPVEPPPPAATADQLEEPSVPTATIKELDDQLASAVPPAVDDEFADGAQMVEGQSLDVPLPPSSPLGELPPVATPVVAPAPEPVAAIPDPVQASVPAPAPAAPAAPVAKPAAPPPPAPAPAPVAKPAPAPASKPAAPAVVAPAKPKGLTLADRFWIVATPVVEPIAVRLGKLPVGFQHTVGWIGIVTLFMAGATWGYVLFFQETRPMSHILEEQMKEHGSAGAADEHGEKGEAGGKHEAGDAEKHGKHEPEAPADKGGEHKAGGAEKSGKAPEAKAPEAKPHAPEAPVQSAKEPAKEAESHGGDEHKPAEHGGH